MAPGTRLLEESYAALHYSAYAVVGRLSRIVSQHLAYRHAIHNGYAQATCLFTSSCNGVQAFRMLSVLFVHARAALTDQALTEILTHLEPLRGSCQPFHHRR